MGQDLHWRHWQTLAGKDAAKRGQGKSTASAKQAKAVKGKLIKPFKDGNHSSN